MDISIYYTLKEDCYIYIHILYITSNVLQTLNNDELRSERDCFISMKVSTRQRPEVSGVYKGSG